MVFGVPDVPRGDPEHRRRDPARAYHFMIHRGPLDLTDADLGGGTFKSANATSSIGGNDDLRCPRNAALGPRTSSPGPRQGVSFH